MDRHSEKLAPLKEALKKQMKELEENLDRNLEPDEKLLLISSLQRPDPLRDFDAMIENFEGKLDLLSEQQKQRVQAMLFRKEEIRQRIKRGMELGFQDIHEKILSILSDEAITNRLGPTSNSIADRYIELAAYMLAMHAESAKQEDSKTEPAAGIKKDMDDDLAKQESI